MRAKKLLIAAFTALIPAGLLSASTSAFAATPPVATISAPNITISSMKDIKVYGRLTNPSTIGAYGDAGWNMAQNADNTPVGYWLFYQERTTDWAMDFQPGSDSLGTYHAYPDGAATSGGNPLRQNGVTFYIREASKTAVKVTRSGSYLTILAGATYYNTKLDLGTRGAWVPYSGQKITIYRWAGGRWKACRSYAAGANGNITAFTVKSAAKQKLYAATGDGNIVWGDASPAVTG